MCSSDLNSGRTNAASHVWYNGITSELMRLTSTGLGIGTSSSSTKLQISGAVSTNNEARFLAKISDTSSVVQGNGGGIIFQGVYTGSTLVDASGVQAYKTNSTDGDYGYGLAFVTRANGGNLIANMRLDSSGNLGLGVTPSAWWSSAKAIDISSVTSLSGGSNFMNLMTNGYINTSGGYTYKTSTYATVYEQTAGKHIFYTAPSGTAGNAISFTQAMTLDASGNLGIGTSSPAYKLEVNGGASDAMSLFNSTNAKIGRAHV